LAELPYFISFCDFSPEQLLSKIGYVSDSEHLKLGCSSVHTKFQKIFAHAQRHPQKQGILEKPFLQTRIRHIKGVFLCQQTLCVIGCKVSYAGGLGFVY